MYGRRWFYWVQFYSLIAVYYKFTTGDTVWLGRADGLWWSNKTKSQTSAVAISQPKLESAEAEPRLLWDHTQLSCKTCCVRTKAIWAYVLEKLWKIILRSVSLRVHFINRFLRFCPFQTWDPWNVPFALSCALRVFRLLSQVTLLRFASVAHVGALWLHSASKRKRPEPCSAILPQVSCIVLFHLWVRSTYYRLGLT